MSETTMNTVSRTIRVIIVDDHPVVREGLRWLLSSEVGFEVCGDAGNVSAALELVRRTSPHAAVVDMLLDNENGLDLIHQIKGLDPNVRILACSMYDDQLYAERALAAGAMGYLNKRAASGQIVAVIRQIMEGEIYLNDETKQDIINRSVGSGPIRTRTAIESLSNRELEIFRLIGHGMTPSEIAAQLNLSAKTVEKHNLNIRRLFQLDSSQKLIREAAQWVLENG